MPVETSLADAAATVIKTNRFGGVRLDTTDGDVTIARHFSPRCAVRLCAPPVESTSAVEEVRIRIRAAFNDSIADDRDAWVLV